MQIAGATCQPQVKIGAFHGVICRTTPSARAAYSSNGCRNGNDLAVKLVGPAGIGFEHLGDLGDFTARVADRLAALSDSSRASGSPAARIARAIACMTRPREAAVCRAIACPSSAAAAAVAATVAPASA